MSLVPTLVGLSRSSIQAPTPRGRKSSMSNPLDYSMAKNVYWR